MLTSTLRKTLKLPVHVKSKGRPKMNKANRKKYRAKKKGKAKEKEQASNSESEDEPDDYISQEESDCDESSSVSEEHVENAGGSC